jgi:hypothetical protein
MPGFVPGGLSLQSTLPPFAVNPTEFAFPVPMRGFTFSRGHSTIDPDIRTPYVVNWTFGYQRELWRNAAIEIRYVGNRGHNLWRSYNINETNIFENGFLAQPVAISCRFKKMAGHGPPACAGRVSGPPGGPPATAPSPCGYRPSEPECHPSRTPCPAATSVAPCVCLRQVRSRTASRRLSGAPANDREGCGHASPHLAECAGDDVTERA